MHGRGGDAERVPLPGQARRDMQDAGEDLPRGGIGSEPLEEGFRGRHVPLGDDEPPHGGTAGQKGEEAAGGECLDDPAGGETGFQPA